MRELGRLTAPPAVHPAEGFPAAGRLRALFFDGLGKLPGIALVHGGGGTAFREWVEKWNQRGFAAISIAVEGQTDERDPKTRWKRHAWAGPERDGI